VDNAKLLEQMQRISPANSQPGSIYAARNEYFPGLVKIGMTRNSVSRRLTNLSCSLPADFELICEAYVANPEAVEATIHLHFANARVRANREFFRIGEAEAIAAFVIARDAAGYDLNAALAGAFAGAA
jgi:hypothetical protein